MEPGNINLLRQGIQELGLACDETRIAKLIAFHDLLMERTQSLNLTGIRDERESVVKNLLNSLGPWRQVHPTKSACDVGSGGGIPGIPLAIALDMHQLTLIESKGKKERFLEEAVRLSSMELPVIQVDVNVAKQRFAQVTVSAFGTLDKIMRSTRSCLASNGRILAFKGRRERIEEELGALKPGTRNHWQVIPFTVPGLDSPVQRHLCVYTMPRRH